jgi:OOP family OmpA-OmpF porin
LHLLTSFCLPRTWRHIAVPLALHDEGLASIRVRETKEEKGLQPMQRKIIQPLGFALVVATASLGAFAAPANDFYVGGSVGATDYPSTVNGVGGGTSNVNGKLFGGYQLTPNVAVEAGLVELGRTRSATGSLNGYGGFVDAVGTWPLGDKWSALGRVGLASTSVRTTAGNDTGTGLKVGLGLQYALTDKVALRGEWERYDARLFGTRPHIDQYTIGLKVGF